MAFEWLAAILGDKSIHLSFKKIGDTTKASTKQVTKRSSKNNSGTINEGGGTQIIQNGPVYNVHVHLGENDTLTPESISALRPVIEQFEAKNVALLAEDSKQVVSDIKNHEQDPDIRGLLKFFRYRLSTSDYQLMRTGLYLKYLRDNRRTDEAKRLWAQNLTGKRQRERRIIELASAGYFSSFFRPFYKQLIKFNTLTAVKRFNKEFEAILSDMRFAIFVHGGMRPDDIVQEVADKAITNIKYGVKAEVISLHATGNSQVNRVKKSLVSLRDIFPVMNISTAPSGTEIIRVDIEYRKNNIDERLLVDDTVSGE